MNPEVKKAWIDALTDGSYEQTYESVLRERKEEGGFRYCAWGVLTDLYCRKYSKMWGEAVDSVCTMKPEVMMWAGVDNELITINERTGFIQTHNDYWKVLFPVLAEAIKEQL